MIEVELETIQMSLVSPHRIVVLRDLDAERYLPIWIGPCEAEAISVRLNGVDLPRPLTHDLTVNILDMLGAELQYIYINALVDNTFYAQLILDLGNEVIEVDSRPSDAMAIAVRADAPIYVSEQVMDEASVAPEPDILEEASREEDLSVFREFLDTLNYDASEGRDN
ncbi:MAG: bifunctional nuclease family protein [Anaerolineales bacterium]